MLNVIGFNNKYSSPVVQPYQPTFKEYVEYLEDISNKEKVDPDRLVNWYYHAMEVLE